MTWLTPELWKKYAVRICHMFSVIAVSGKIIYDYMFSDSLESSSGQSAFYGILGLVLIVSGLINTFLQKPTENLKDDKGPWMISMYVKFGVTLIACTPIPKLLGFSKQEHVALQFYVILAFIIISPLLRFYREHYTEQNKIKKFSYENMDLK